MENLWPELDLEIETRSSKKIMLEQAEFLMKSTKNVLEATVTTSTHNNSLDHSFNVVAPQLDGYSCTLFFVRQNGLIMYPCTLFFDGTGKPLQNEETFIEELKNVFSHPTTRTIIASLYAQSRDEKPSFQE